MLAFAHSPAMSVVLPGSSTRSQRPRLRIWRRSCGALRARRRGSAAASPGSWSATSAKACTSRANCFSITSRPADDDQRVVERRARGEARAGAGSASTTISGATAPSCSRSQSAVARASASRPRRRAGANASSGSRPEVRSEEERCSWCTSDRRCRAAAGRRRRAAPGVTVTRTSASSRGSALVHRDVGERRELPVPARRHQHRRRACVAAPRRRRRASRGRRRGARPSTRGSTS